MHGEAAVCGLRQGIPPRPLVPQQKYCGAEAYRRARRRRWQQAKHQCDAAYRENQARAQRVWVKAIAIIGARIVETPAILPRQPQE
jgi:hypothetical protein